MKSIFYYLFKWIEKYSALLILVPHPVAIGNCGEEIYFALLKARREGRKLLVLPLHGGARWARLPVHGNLALINISSDYRSACNDTRASMLISGVMTFYSSCFRFVNRVLNRVFRARGESPYLIKTVHTVPVYGQYDLWRPRGVTQFSWDVVDGMKWKKTLEAPVPVSLSGQQVEQCRQSARELGLPEGAWFVCLHVRDAGYYSDAKSNERMASISNYLPAIQEITRRGGWVVRMGDTKMVRLPSMERVIDYPFTHVKSPLMDLYLISQCRFYFGMQSGILEVARLFNRPTILANMHTWVAGFPQQRGDLGILKHIYSKRENRYIHPLEWPSTPWGSGTLLFEPYEDFVYVENTEEEIAALVSEYLERDDDWMPTPLQQAFNTERHTKGRTLLSRRFLDGDPVVDSDFRYRIAAYLESAQGHISSSFLETYLPPDAPH